MGSRIANQSTTSPCLSVQSSFLARARFRSARTRRRIQSVHSLSTHRGRAKESREVPGFRAGSQLRGRADVERSSSMTTAGKVDLAESAWCSTSRTSSGSTIRAGWSRNGYGPITGACSVSWEPREGGEEDDVAQLGRSEGNMRRCTTHSRGQAPGRITFGACSRSFQDARWPIGVATRSAKTPRHAEPPDL
jgi:hypothetical protein